MGESSRLFVELREKRALTYDFDAINVSGLDYGYFSVTCPVSTKSLDLTQTLIRDELQKVKNQPPSKNELDKSKNMLLGGIFRVMDNFHELPGLLAYDEIHFKNRKSLIDYINKINSLTEKDVTEVANKYFQRRKLLNCNSNTREITHK